MKEYIERADALDVVKRTSGDYAAAWAEIAHIPAADVVEVRHGKWIDPENDDRYTAWHCSRCEYPVKTLGGRPDCRYCPTCGTRMDKEDKHNADTP